MTEHASPSLTTADYIDVLQVRFPRITREDALSLLLDAVARRRTMAVCFPDMSTLNLAARQPSFRQTLQTRFLTLNDGAGLAWAARRRGKPLPDNLNGTDLCPNLLTRLPPETTIYVLGGRPRIPESAVETLALRFPHLRFVGCHHGFLAAQTESQVVADLHRLRPQLVLVAMGNPLQVEFIDRHLDDERLAGTLWLAVGGLIDYYAGGLRRAPIWCRRLRLEWLSILLQQPHKTFRYLLGIPQFVWRCVVADIRSSHDLREATPREGEVRSFPD